MNLRQGAHPEVFVEGDEAEPLLEELLPDGPEGRQEAVEELRGEIEQAGVVVVVGREAEGLQERRVARRVVGLPGERHGAGLGAHPEAVDAVGREVHGAVQSEGALPTGPGSDLGEQGGARVMVSRGLPVAEEGGGLAPDQGRGMPERRHAGTPRDAPGGGPDFFEPRVGS